MRPLAPLTVRLRPAHLVCFLLLLATLGTAHAVPTSVQELAVRSRVRGELERRSLAALHLEHAPRVQRALTPPAVLPGTCGVAAILATGNHPALRSAALQVFTASLR